MSRIKTWMKLGFARDAVSIVTYRLRNQKMRLVAVVASKSNMSSGILTKLVWLGAVILIAMITRFTMARSLWRGIGAAVTKTALTQNTSTKRGKHLG